MNLKNFTQLGEFLFKKKQRFVDLFLWQLHLERIVDRRNSVGFHNDIEACVHSLEGKYRIFNKAKYSVDNYIKICNQSLIPDEYLTWIDKKNIRQCNFVWLYLKSKNYFNEVTLDIAKINADKHYMIIRALDLIPEDMPLKIERINSIKNAWLGTKKYHGWRYDWLDIHNESQCKKAIDFLTKKISVKAKKNYSKPPLADDDNELSDYYKFLASVDTWQAFPVKKETFHKKINDTARNWITQKQKKEKIKLKSKAKENNHILLKDEKSLKILQSIQAKMEHKNLNDTLKYILNEKHDEIFKLSNVQEVKPKEVDVNKSPYNLKSFEILKERASSQLRTLCDYSIKLQRADIFDNKMSKSSKQKAKELFKDKEIKLFEGVD